MAKRRNTIGENPLDLQVPAPDSPGTPAPLSTENHRKERLTVHIPLELIERIKNAVYWTPGLTMSQLAEDSFLQRISTLEQERGGVFPPRTQELKRGRPVT